MTTQTTDHKRNFAAPNWLALGIALTFALSLGWDAHQHHMSVLAVIAITTGMFSGAFLGIQHLVTTWARASKEARR